MTRILFLLLTVLLAKCKGPSDHLTKRQGSSHDTLIIILPFQTGLMTPFTKDDLPVVLNSSDLVLTDSLVRSAVKTHNAAIPEEKSASLGIDLNRIIYRRQYIAALNPAGDTLVWVNCFCGEQTPSNWRKELIIVEDGGNCYFNLTVNLTKRRVINIFVNGEG